MQDTLDRKTYQPIKLDHTKIQSEIDEIRKTDSLVSVVDTIEEQSEELLLLRNPKYRFDKEYKQHLEDFKNELSVQGSLDNFGNWFYFPWLRTVAHYLPEEMHFEMRTGRNKLLITPDEQKTFYNSCVGFLGLSVGSHAALTSVMTGGVKYAKIADPDTISGSNLNRIRTGALEIGLPKAVFVARNIYQINPYIELEVFLDGLTDQNMESFLTGEHPLSVLVEEMDNPYFKLKVREVAKLHKVPVVMATDNGDNIFLDIERFDLNPDAPLLNGLIGNMTAEELRALDPKDLPRTAAKIAGAELATLRMQQSVLLVGKELYSWPQLGTAANLCGSALSYVIRKIVTGASNIVSGRYEVNLDAAFESDYHDPEVKKSRQDQTDKFLHMIGLK